MYLVNFEKIRLTKNVSLFTGAVFCYFPRKFILFKNYV